MDNDKNIKEGCPFCGTPFNKIDVRTPQPRYHVITCPKCGVIMSGNNLAVLYTRWNCRVH